MGSSYRCKYRLWVNGNPQIVTTFPRQVIQCPGFGTRYYLKCRRCCLNMFFTFGLRLPFRAGLGSNVYLRSHSRGDRTHTHSWLLNDEGPNKGAKGIIQRLRMQRGAMSIEFDNKVSQTRDVTTCGDINSYISDDETNVMKSTRDGKMGVRTPLPSTSRSSLNLRHHIT
jgi:hypothetical protein